MWSSACNDRSTHPMLVGNKRNPKKSSLQSRRRAGVRAGSAESGDDNVGEMKTQRQTLLRC